MNGCRFFTLFVLLYSATAVNEAWALPPTVEQVDDALDIAERTARNGLIELSIEAVRRALMHGPPERLRDNVDRTPGLGILVDTVSRVPQDPLDAIRARIPECIFRLSTQWNGSANPQAVYRALRDIVLPVDGSNKVELYAVPLRIDPAQPDRLPVARSVAQELVTWASRAGTLAELQKHIQSHPAAESLEAHLLLIMCATQMGDTAVIKEYTVGLSEKYGNGTVRSTAEMIAFVGASLSNSESHFDLAASLLETAGRAIANLDALSPQPNSAARAALLKAARIRFAMEENESAVALLRAYLQTKVRGRHGIASAGLENRRSETVARELLGRHLKTAAQELLGDEYRRFQSRYILTESSAAAEVPEAGGREVIRDGQLVRIIAADDTDDDMSSFLQVAVLDLDRAESHTLFYLPDFSNVIAPAVSPDGSEVAFSATLPGEAVTSGTHVYVASMDGRTIRSLGSGTLPSWSPRGQRLALSGYSPDRGVWISAANGRDRLLIDDTGWGGRWSPDGRMIAYTKLVEGRWDLIVYDLVEDELISLFQSSRRSFGSIYGGFQWSSDSRYLYFKSTRDATDSNSSTYTFFQADVSARKPLREVFVHRGYAGNDMASLSANGDTSLVVPLRQSARRSESLYQVRVGSNNDPVYLKGQHAGRRNSSVARMPDDSSRLLYVSGPER